MRQRLSMSRASTLGDKLSFIGTGRNNHRYNIMFDSIIVVYTVTRVYIIILSARSYENRSPSTTYNLRFPSRRPRHHPNAKRLSMIIL